MTWPSAIVEPEDRSKRVFVAIAVALVALGAVLRSLGYFGGIELWSDESGWVDRIVAGQKVSKRPIGYVRLSEWLIQWRATEAVIRLPSYVAGIVSLPLLAIACRLAGVSRAATLAGLLSLAVHPAAVSLSKEFKPYALDLFFHLLLLALSFSYIRSGKHRDALALAVVAPLSLLFSWMVVALFPGVYLTAWARALRVKSRSQFATVTISAATSASALGVIYWHIVRNTKRSRSAAYWGKKYDVFHIEGDDSLLGWVLSKTAEIAEFPVHLQPSWLGSWLNEAVGSWHVALCVVGVAAMFLRRKWAAGALWLLPWLVTLGLNLIGKWPYGVFRTNLFLLAHSLGVALVGLDSVAHWLQRSFEGRSTAARAWARHSLSAYFVLFGFCFLPSDWSAFATKERGTLGNTQFTRRGMDAVLELDARRRKEIDDPNVRQRRPWLLLDGHACENFTYYTKRHPDFRERYRKAFRSFRPRCLVYDRKGIRRSVRRFSKRGFWMLTAKPALGDTLLPYASRYCELSRIVRLPQGNLVFRCDRKKKGTQKPKE